MVGKWMISPDSHPPTVYKLNLNSLKPGQWWGILGTRINIIRGPYFPHPCCCSNFQQQPKWLCSQRQSSKWSILTPRSGCIVQYIQHSWSVGLFWHSRQNAALPFSDHKNKSYTQRHPPLTICYPLQPKAKASLLISQRRKDVLSFPMATIEGSLE